MHKALLIDAKVPIIKSELLMPHWGPGSKPLQVDISLGATNGAAAVHFIQDHVDGLPPLRPLVLAVKAFLKSRALNETFTGGLSSYSLVNMAIAYLQLEGGYRHHAYAIQQRLHEATRGLPKAQRFPEPVVPEETARQQEERPPEQDLGLLLAGFFEFFGARIQTETEAVSVRRGGLCPKHPSWLKKNRGLLAVEDPQEPGRDIGRPLALPLRLGASVRVLTGLCVSAAAGSATYRIGDVREALVAAADELYDALDSSGSGESPDGFHCLRRILPVQQVLSGAGVPKEEPKGGKKTRAGKRGRGEKMAVKPRPAPQQLTEWHLVAQQNPGARAQVHKGGKFAREKKAREANPFLGYPGVLMPGQQPMFPPAGDWGWGAGQNQDPRMQPQMPMLQPQHQVVMMQPGFDPYVFQPMGGEASIGSYPLCRCVNSESVAACRPTDGQARFPVPDDSTAAA